MFNRERLVFARVALALAVLWAVVGAHLSHTRTLKDEATGERLRTTTEIAMAQLDAAIRHTDDVLLHTKGAVERFGPGLLIDDILPARAWSPAVPYDGITVLDPAGVAVVATGARLTAALATALVTRPIDDVRGLVVSAAPPEAADARDRIWLSRHVQSPDGTFASTVAARVSAERIDALLAAAGVDTDAVRLRLVDDAGRLFAGHPPGVEDRTVAIPIERLGLVLRGSLDAAHWRSAWRTEATPILVLTALVTLLLLLVARMRTGRATAVDRAFGPAFDRAFDRGMAEAATAAEPVSRDLGALAGAFAGRRVLIALDDPATRAIVATQLAAFGCIVDAVEDGHEAVTQARNGTFDLILLDGQMPGMDGPEAARQIRQAEAAAGGGARTPIIALTAESPAEERARARAAGMDDHVSMPFEPHQLAATMRRWLAIPTAAPAPVVVARPAPRVAPVRPDHAAARFLDDTPPLIDALHSALAAGNLDAARAVAHQLGEGARRLGADQLTALLHEIELLSPRDDAGAAALATAIDGAIARVRESLRREVA